MIIPAASMSLDSVFTDRSQFYGLLEAHLAKEQFKDQPPEDFLKGGYRFRHRVIPHNVEAMLRGGSMTLRAITDRLGASMAEVKRALATQQQNGEWALIAWKVEERQLPRRANTPAEKQAWGMHMGTDSPQQTKEVVVTETQILVHTYWTDLLKAPEIDNWKARTGRDDGAMSGGRIPARLRQEYRDTEEALRQFCADRDRTVEGPEFLMSEQALADVTDMRERGVPWVVIARHLGQDREALEKEFEERTAKPAPKVTRKRKPKADATPATPAGEDPNV